MSSLLIHTLPPSLEKPIAWKTSLIKLIFLSSNKLKSRVTFLTKIHFNAMSGLITLFLRDSAKRLEMAEILLFWFKASLDFVIYADLKYEK